MMGKAAPAFPDLALQVYAQEQRLRYQEAKCYILFNTTYSVPDAIKIPEIKQRPRCDGCGARVNKEMHCEYCS